MTIPAHLNAEPGEFYVELHPASPVFPAIINWRRRDSWAVPDLRRPVAEAVLAWLDNQHQHGDFRWRSGRFDGDTLILIDRHGTQTRIAADSGGRYRLGDEAWRWFISAPGPDQQASPVLEANSSVTRGHAGEDLVTLPLTGDDPTFPAIVESHPGSRQVVPYFRRPVVDTVMAWINHLYLDNPRECNRAYWDGDTVVIVTAALVGEDGYLPTRVPPEEDGRYCVGGGEWAWRKLDARNLLTLDQVETALRDGTCLVSATLSLTESEVDLLAVIVGAVLGCLESPGVDFDTLVATQFDTDPRDWWDWRA